MFSVVAVGCRRRKEKAEQFFLFGHWLGLLEIRSSIVKIKALQLRPCRFFLFAGGPGASMTDRDPAAPVVGGVKAGPRYGRGGFLPVAAIVAAVVMTWLKECGRCLSEQRRGVIRSAAGGSGRCRSGRCRWICCRSWLHPYLTEIRPPRSSAG
ncbi:hypothetical protein JWG42_01695 [Desulfoprunum benzoelyticum]|uniref:Uncharacterized protein n=1 Tax=Desulfoprunum benzoelyticum TaxID=1506996 RepID=A0A840UTH4_9BACT|nr:hypothetical protein [Desulfoprunum benzoelyticum]MBB5348975.1 hypothetical protein [Desulfoprunum benzoelyticum]MBM9528864.1 hypothetical protein [Desulfoprunum benzoelyticum]